jgi:predicted RNA-binding protein with PUA-like domain
MKKKFWLMKTEPDVYSIDRLAKEKKTAWTGVRNYQARNFMMNEMQVGDEVLFYHSSTEPPGIAGLARVCTEARPDKTALDKKCEYYDKNATPENPIWFCVEVEFQSKFKNYLELATLRETPGLADMALLRKGQRLSIQPVRADEFKIITKMAAKNK